MANSGRDEKDVGGRSRTAHFGSWIDLPEDRPLDTLKDLQRPQGWHPRSLLLSRLAISFFSPQDHPHRYCLHRPYRQDLVLPCPYQLPRPDLPRSQGHCQLDPFPPPRQNRHHSLRRWDLSHLAPPELPLQTLLPYSRSQPFSLFHLFHCLLGCSHSHFLGNRLVRVPHVPPSHPRQHLCRFFLLFSFPLRPFCFFSSDNGSWIFSWGKRFECSR